MKLQDLLEQRYAPVHVNVDNTLFVIPSLLQKRFGLRFPSLKGACLASQMVFSMSAVSGVPPEQLAAAAKYLKGSLGGVTLSELFNVFNNKPIKIDDKKTVIFNLSVKTYNNVDTVLQDVQRGQPVVMIVPADSKIYSGIQSLEQPLGDDEEAGIIDIDKERFRSERLDFTMHSLTHAYLVIGYDKPHDHMIVREMRSKYGFKGYAKIPANLFRQNKKAVRFVAIVVDDFKFIKNK